MTEAGEWREQCIAVAHRLGATDEILERIDQYYSDEQTYDDPHWPDPEEFVEDEINNIDDIPSDEQLRRDERRQMGIVDV